MGTKAREGKDRTRIGSRHAKMQNGLQVVVRDSFPVTERIGESVTQRPLDRVESAQILMDTWDGKKDKEKIALFLENGRVYIQPCRIWHTQQIIEITCHMHNLLDSRILKLLRGGQPSSRKQRNIGRDSLR